MHVIDKSLLLLATVLCFFNGDCSDSARTPNFVFIINNDQDLLLQGPVGMEYTADMMAKEGASLPTSLPTLPFAVLRGQRCSAANTPTAGTQPTRTPACSWICAGASFGGRTSVCACRIWTIYCGRLRKIPHFGDGYDILLRGHFQAHSWIQFHPGFVQRVHILQFVEREWYFGNDG